MSASYEELIGNAILGIDTIWGGDVLCASGTGRFIADSWFSDAALPRAYTVAEAAPVRASGGVSATSQIRLLKPVTAAQSDAYMTMRTGCQRSTRLPANSRQHATAIKLAALILPIWSRSRPRDCSKNTTYIHMQPPMAVNIVYRNISQ